MMSGCQSVFQPQHQPSKLSTCPARFEQDSRLKRLRQTSEHMQVELPKRHWNWVNCLLHLYAELGRIRITADMLRPYQREIISGLAGGASEEAFAKMFDPKWCMPSLGSQDKPQIDVAVSLTSKNNLSVIWELKKSRSASELGFYAPHWHRPINELLFVRGVTDAMSGLSMHRCETSKASVHDLIDQCLLIATAAAVRNLRERLEHIFDVCLVTDVFMTWTSDLNGKALVSGDELYDWEVGSVEERARSIELKEVEKLAVACPIADLVDALEWSIRRTKRGPAPTARDERISRFLRDGGFHQMTPPIVRRYRELLRKHYPEALPVWDRPDGSDSKA